MKWEMEILSPAPYIPNTNWGFEENYSRNSKWTAAENKLFENALAVYDKDSPDRWHKVAAMIPGKTVNDVMKQYKELEVDVSNIEAGLVPIPVYNPASPFTLDWVNTSGYVGFRGIGGKRSSSGRAPEQERKKGVPWTEDEHKLFLLGLKKYGKGDWRNISRNFVITRTPTQVASHAQKYFIRQLSGGKDKRRASIHDITTVNLNDTTRTPSLAKEGSGCGGLGGGPMLSHHQHHHPHSPAATPRAQFQWNQANAAVAMGGHEKMYMSTYGVNSYGQNLHRNAALHDSSFLPPQNQNMVFQTQSYSHA
ncbi:hypothetical protein L6164_028586 [Bauhinia variegata]|uniref:Uncharacterized protein n=1 Tax=Bauhinia variegata TaxID=167791 RepID=A0ACB9L738_BAUVA|nr:hypothetical protein L6164_028586 [Bauhinia variegata]